MSSSSSNNNCIFPCFPSLPDFSSTRDPLLMLWGEDDGIDVKRKPAEILKLHASSGALQLPQYQPMPRDTCPLLRHAWSQNWDKVIDICALEPHRALHKTEHSGRTALHLATFNRQCPLSVAKALLTANRHMVLVQDSNRYTPLHIVAFFSSVKPVPQHSDEKNIKQQLKEQQEEESRLMDLFCATAIMVEQELQDTTLIPPAYGTSPLFLAAKRNAPLGILQTLLHTRHRTFWIAPSRGGEPYWDAQTYSSPLEVLLRDSNRASQFLDPEKLRTNPELTLILRDVAFKRLSRKRGDSGTVVEDLQNHDGDARETILLWEKCIELLAAHVPLLEVGEDAAHIPYGVLHAVVSCKVPVPSLVQAALIVFPEQAFQRDEQGMIPLHHVLCGNPKYATTQLLNILLSEKQEVGDSSRLRSTALVCFPNNGPTPLAFALMKHLPVDPVINKLLETDSDISLHTMDPSTRLYPFCFAALQKKNCVSIEEETATASVKTCKSSKDCAEGTNSVSAREEDLERLDLTFQLLLAHPQVLAHCLDKQEGCS